MMIRINKEFVLALGLHSLFLLLFILQLQHCYKSVGTQAEILHAYIYHFANTDADQQAIAAQTRQAQQKAVQKSQRPVLKKANSLTVQRQSLTAAQTQTKQASRLADLQDDLQQGATQTGNYNALLELLHNAIANAQIYPQAALLLGQQGKVLVSFDLLPDGTIKNIHVIQSSRQASLDKAAMQAVSAIAPFKLAQHFLTASQSFAITIEFKSII